MVSTTHIHEFKGSGSKGCAGQFENDKKMLKNIPKMGALAHGGISPQETNVVVIQSGPTINQKN